jgi:hypothetical protein
MCPAGACDHRVGFRFFGKCTSAPAHRPVAEAPHSSHSRDTGSAYRAIAAPALQWSSWCSQCSAQRGYHGVRPHRVQGRRTEASLALPRRRPRNDDSARLHALGRRCAWTRHRPDEPAAEAPVVAEPSRHQREHRVRCATAWAHAGRFIVGRGRLVAGVHRRLRLVESRQMADVRRHDRPLEPAAGAREVQQQRPDHCHQRRPGRVAARAGPEWRRWGTRIFI